VYKLVKVLSACVSVCVCLDVNQGVWGDTNPNRCTQRLGILPAKSY